MQKIHILDGYGYIFRAFYGMARGTRLSNAAGMPTGALHVYGTMLLRLYQEIQPDRVVVVFDAPGKTFRDELDPNYKQTRRETPADLKVQLPHFRPLTEAFCWPVVSIPGVEADDTIATITTLARQREWDVVIYSGDKDLMQLVDDHVTVVDSMRRITYDAARVQEKFGVRPDQLGDWLSLVGDASDNIPGMVGVGKVGATKMLAAHNDLNGILSHVDDMKGKQRERFCDAKNLAQLEMSKRLVTLKRDVVLPVELDSFVPLPWDASALADICDKLGFTGQLARLAGRTMDSPPTAAPSAPPVSAVEVPEVAWESQSAEALTDPAAIAAFAAAATKAGHCAMVLEADGTRHDRERLVSLCLAIPGAPPQYIPVAHRYLGAPRALAADVLAPIYAVLEDPSVAILCHDAKESYKILAREGVTLRGVAMDLMLASYLLHPTSQDHTAVSALQTCCDIALPNRETMVGKGKKAIPWEMVEVGHAATYSGPVVGALLAAVPRLRGQLKQAGMYDLFRDLELPLTRVLADMELRGITLQKPVLTEIRDTLGGRIAELETTVFAAAGGPFNLGSPKQLATLLFDTLELQSKVMKKTKTGFSTDHEVLEAMVDAHEIIPPIMEHRELLKLKGTYVDALPPLVNPKTQRLHTSFRQDVTSTGRLSSQDPNLQNIPIRTELGRSVRRAFSAQEGHTLISADYSQIELRIMAHMSQDPVLTRAFVDGIDVHTQTASEVFDIPLAEVGSQERRVAKAVNYGLIYGQSAFGLGRSLGISSKQAARYIDLYFQRFSRVREFMDDIVHRARIAGAATTISGRILPIPTIGATDFTTRAAAERVAQNAPMQGSAADIMKMAMLKVDALLRKEHPQAEILLTVHDELIIEVPVPMAEEVGHKIQVAMESAHSLQVPLVVDIGIAKSWAEAH